MISIIENILMLILRSIEMERGLKKLLGFSSLLCLLSGCNVNAENSEKTNKKIKIGSDTYPPFVCIDNNGY